MNKEKQLLVSKAIAKGELNVLHELLADDNKVDINSGGYWGQICMDLKTKEYIPGDTMLGYAAYHGHLEIVQYLVEVHMADVNVKDADGQTPLHRVVIGDAYPFDHGGNGNQHEEVAKYLIKMGADLSITNNKGRTPYDLTKWCAPLKIESLLGRRFITNTGSALYYADKVRPIFIKEQQDLEKNIPVVTIREREPSLFPKFCLEHVISAYVSKNRVGYCVADKAELFNMLSDLSEEQWRHMILFITSREPAPYSFRLGLINDKWSPIAKQSILVGLATMCAVYYTTENAFLAIISGITLSKMTWDNITNSQINKVENKMKDQYARANELKLCNKFFKPSRDTSYQNSVDEQASTELDYSNLSTS